MRHYFDECPDCGEYYSKIGNMPELARRLSTHYKDNEFVAKNVIKAVCNRCGWETKYHDNVGQCAEEWNNTKLYEEQTPVTSPDVCEPNTCGDCLRFYTRGNLGCNSRWFCHDDDFACEEFVHVTNGFF